MLIVPDQTYRGKHGLYVQGHPVNLPEYLIAQIDAELQMRNPPERFTYRKVDNPRQINKPAKAADKVTKTQQTPKDKAFKGPAKTK